MNRSVRGFSITELLIASMIFLIMIGGVCYLMLALPRIAYLHTSSLHVYQQQADFGFLFNKDMKKAGYGLTRFSSLLTFVPLIITANGENNRNSCSIFWNKDEVIARLINKTKLAKPELVIPVTATIQEGNYALLTEHDPVNGEPHWALIRIVSIERMNEGALRITFAVISLGPKKDSDEFHELAYFVKVEKISYYFSADERKIMRVINDAVFQPVLEFVKENDYNYCKFNDDVVMKNCIEYGLIFQTRQDKIERFRQIIYIPNIHF